ncbi:MAG TPA: hypothetical protein ENI57_12670 [Ignavibacteria bacterium]|nr:hypothetical protein [Ignavibacteria bacterium]
MTFNPDTPIDNSEFLFRAIRPFQDHWNFEKGKLSSGFYKSSLPISVERDGARSNEEIIDSFKSFFTKYFGVSKIQAEDCRKCETDICPDKKPDNIYHAIIEEPGRSGVSSSKAKCLTRSTIIVEFPILSDLST